MAVTQYTTSEGDRWDTIAQKAYGDSSLISLIIESNKALVISETLTAGIIINIPILEPDETDNIDVNLLPPWKR